MEQKKKTPGQKAGDWIEGVIRRARYQCEVCYERETPKLPLYVHFIDRDAHNRKRKNLAVFCTGCGRNFTRANPEGLTIRGGTWAFAINRGLYRGMIIPDPPRG